MAFWCTKLAYIRIKDAIETTDNEKKCIGMIESVDTSTENLKTHLSGLAMVNYKLSKIFVFYWAR